MQIHPSLSLIRPCLPSVATAVEVRRAHVRQWGGNHKEIPACSVWHVLLAPACCTQELNPAPRDNGCSVHTAKRMIFMELIHKWHPVQNLPSLFFRCSDHVTDRLMITGFSGSCGYTRNAGLHPLLMRK